jgi:hypothetical protein
MYEAAQLIIALRLTIRKAPDTVNGKFSTHAGLWTPAVLPEVTTRWPQNSILSTEVCCLNLARKPVILTGFVSWFTSLFFIQILQWCLDRAHFQIFTLNHFFNSHCGEWSPNRFTRHVGHWMAYCTCPGWLWWWRIWWNENWQRKPKYSEKTCPSATLSTTNPTWPDAGLNPGRRGGKPATNRLIYGATLHLIILNYITIIRNVTMQLGKAIPVTGQRGL